MPRIGWLAGWLTLSVSLVLFFSQDASVLGIWTGVPVPNSIFRLFPTGSPHSEQNFSLAGALERRSTAFQIQFHILFEWGVKENGGEKERGKREMDSTQRKRERVF